MKPEIHNKILIVDDDPEVLESMSALLNEEGYSVTSCSSAKEAMIKLQENNIDVVITDIRMPEISGIDLIDKIHNNNSQVPVILMTAYADLNVAVEAINKGAFDFIIKPSPPDYLLHSIKRAFQHSSYLKLKENYKRYLEDMVRQRTQELLKEVEERKHTEESLRRSEKQLRALASRLQEVEESEKKELAWELHDQVGQNLTALNLNLTIIRNELSPELLEKVGARLNDSMALVEETAEKIGDVMADLRHEVLDESGLVAALRWYSERFKERTGVNAAVHGDDILLHIPEVVQLSLFRISQEALTNIAKHAEANQVSLSVEERNGLLRLTIADNGKGIDITNLNKSRERHGWGLLTMKERAQALGGEVWIDSEPGKGARVTVEVKI